MVNAIEARFYRIDEANQQKTGESRDDFYRRLIQEAEERTEAADQAAVLAAQNGGNSIQLTEEQKAYLSKYDSRNMSLEEYEALLKDLEEMGCFSGEETGILRYGTSARLNGIWEAPDQYGGMSGRFEYSGGNLLDWARFRASYEAADQNGARYHDRTALLFDKLCRVLKQL